MIETILNLPNQSGIYKITSPTGNIYIGESSNLKVRCKSYLNPNKIKKQRGIYNSLLKHGIESHKFEIICYCEPNKLKELERYYQEFYNSIEMGLNCNYTKTSEKSFKHSEETKKIISEKSTGKKNHFYGKKHTSESLKKISESSKGVNNPNYGGKLINDEWLLKQKLSNSKKPLIIIDLLTNQTYKFINSKDAAKHLNCSDSVVRSAKLYGYKIKKRYLVKDDII